MGEIIVNIGGGGGVSSGDVTASRLDVVQGKRTVTTDSGDEVVEGTLPEIFADTGQINSFQSTQYGIYCVDVPKGAYRRGDLGSAGGRINIELSKLRQDIGYTDPKKVLPDAVIAGQAGTMVVQGGTTIVPGTSNKTAVAANRYVNGNVIVAGEPNLRPENIRKGVTVFGVSGTLDGVFTEDGDIYFEGKWIRSNSMTTRVYNGYMQFTAVNEGTSYLCRNHNNRSSYPAMGLLNPVNLSGIKRVYVRFTAISKYAIDLYINNIIGSDNDVKNNRVAYARMEPQIGQVATIEVDVSGLSGNHYITLLQNYVSAMPGNDAFRIHRIGTRV